MNGFIVILGKILGDSSFINTPKGIIPRRLLKPARKDAAGAMDQDEEYDDSNSGILITDQGSRIGVVFVPTDEDENMAEMHFIINGVDQGACTNQIPLGRAPLYVVIDVYGTTKKIRIIQLYGSKCNDFFLN